jgi:hypothetical protein
MSLLESLEQFSTEAQCGSALERRRWPAGFRGPNRGCGAHCMLRGPARTTVQCNACHYQTSLIAGTLFERTKPTLTFRL